MPLGRSSHPEIPNRQDATVTIRHHRHNLVDVAISRYLPALPSLEGSGRRHSQGATGERSAHKPARRALASASTVGITGSVWYFV